MRLCYLLWAPCESYESLIDAAIQCAQEMKRVGLVTALGELKAVVEKGR